MAEAKDADLARQLQRCFGAPSSAAAAAPGDNTLPGAVATTTTTTTTNKSRQQQRPRPADPVVMYILPDGSAIELLRPHEVAHCAAAARSASDGVNSNVFVAEDGTAVICSVPNVTASAAFAASNASLTRPYLSAQAPSSSFVANDAKPVRCGNGPARSVADFLQRVHTYTAAPASFGPLLLLQPAQTTTTTTTTTSRTVVATQMYITAAQIGAPGIRGAAQHETYSQALRALHRAAPALTGLERSDSAAAAAAAGNASHFPVEASRAPRAVPTTKGAFTGHVALRRDALAAALGDGEAARYFNPDTEPGSEAIARSHADHVSGAWRGIVDEADGANRHQHAAHGTRGGGFAHFNAAAAKVHEVGRGGMLSSPGHQQRMAKRSAAAAAAAAATATTSPTKAAGVKVGGSLPPTRPTAPPLARVNTHDYSKAQAACDLAMSASGAVQARLTLEPAHVEFAPLRRGLRYHTSLSLINVGSSATRFRAKIVAVSLSSSSSSNAAGVLPPWLRAEIPHVRLGPGMRAPIVFEVTGHQPAGESTLEVVVAYEGPMRNTLTATSTVRIVTVDASHHRGAGAPAGAASNNNTTATASGVRTTPDGENSTGGATPPSPPSPSPLHNNNSSNHHALLHQQALCWVATTGNTVECLGPSPAVFVPGSVRRVERSALTDAADDVDSD